MEITNANQPQLESEVTSAYSSGKLVKGFYETLNAISLYHTNPVVKIVIGQELDPTYLQVLSKGLQESKLDLPVVRSQNKMLVSNIVRKIEELEGKKPRKPFTCKLFCITKNPK